MDKTKLAFIAAPMVNQSDLPFRHLVMKYGATLVYTQMLIPDQLLNDRDYLEFHLRDLTLGRGHASDVSPVVVQLCGNDPEIVVKAGKTIQSYCDGIGSDLNLGCPQEAASEGHYGGYLLGQKDWSLVGDIVTAMSSSLSVPVSAKLRLCNPASSTSQLAQKLEGCGASWITLHARTVSARRRRHGPANLEYVKALKEVLNVPVVSNGNVREWSHLASNREFTGADGLMVGESLLANPCLFSGLTPDPFEISLEYLSLCKEFPETATLATVQAHIRHFIEHKQEHWSGTAALTVAMFAGSEDTSREVVRIFLRSDVLSP
ncbi:hypothetical protein ONZ45_g5978 [Pleurotus djamor]|nr:hypothetical protein ONZ45_g5978 [Pleurotus djamor]